MSHFTNAPENQKRKARPVAIDPLPSGYVNVDHNNSVGGTLGSYNAGLWTFPSGTYAAYGQMIVENSSYPNILDKVTVRISIGPAQEEFPATLFPASPGRTLVQYHKLFTVPVDSVFKTEIKMTNKDGGATAATAALSDQSETYVIRIGAAGIV